MKIAIAEGGLKGGTWNHRVIRHQYISESMLEIHEVYYDENGKVSGWTKTGKSPVGETLEELRESLGLMLKATATPVLTVVKRGARQILVEVGPGGKEAVGKALKDMSPDERAAGEALRQMLKDMIDED